MYGKRSSSTSWAVSTSFAPFFIRLFVPLLVGETTLPGTGRGAGGVFGHQGPGAFYPPEQLAVLSRVDDVYPRAQYRYRAPARRERPAMRLGVYPARTARYYS